MASIGTESLDYMRGWLRGFFDGEGGVRCKVFDGKKFIKEGKEAYAVNTDPALIHRCESYLSALGITVFKTTEHPHVVNGRKKSFTKVHIGTYAGLIQFAKEIGFTTTWKRERLFEILLQACVSRDAILLRNLKTAQRNRERIYETPISRERLFDLYVAQKKSGPEISQIVFGSRNKVNVVHGWLKKMKIPHRSRSEARFLWIQRRKEHERSGTNS